MKNSSAGTLGFLLFLLPSLAFAVRPSCITEITLLSQTVFAHTDVSRPAETESIGKGLFVYEGSIFSFGIKKRAIPDGFIFFPGDEVTSVRINVAEAALQNTALLNLQVQELTGPLLSETHNAKTEINILNSDNNPSVKVEIVQEYAVFARHSLLKVELPKSSYEFAHASWVNEKGEIERKPQALSEGILENVFILAIRRMMNSGYKKIRFTIGSDDDLTKDLLLKWGFVYEQGSMETDLVYITTR